RGEVARVNFENERDEQAIVDFGNRSGEKLVTRLHGVLPARNLRRRISPAGIFSTTGDQADFTDRAWYLLTHRTRAGGGGAGASFSACRGAARRNRRSPRRGSCPDARARASARGPVRTPLRRARHRSRDPRRS